MTCRTGNAAHLGDDAVGGDGRQQEWRWLCGDRVWALAEVGANRQPAAIHFQETCPGPVEAFLTWARPLSARPR